MRLNRSLLGFFFFDDGYSCKLLVWKEKVSLFLKNIAIFYWVIFFSFMQEEQCQSIIQGNIDNFIHTSWKSQQVGYKDMESFLKLKKMKSLVSLLIFMECPCIPPSLTLSILYMFLEIWYKRICFFNIVQFYRMKKFQFS